MSTQLSALRIQVINGPNLNLLGRREPGLYGDVTLDDICRGLGDCARELNVEIEFYQSNIEGELVTTIQKAKEKGIHGILINPGAYTHTSIAIRDALLAVQIPFAEIHISNTFSRESFRQQSYLSDLAAGVVVGFGPQGYELALLGLVGRLKQAI
ncbi:MAG: type II 3-dehydroquinate dehydratase [Candidatus Obscuribacterales bacterium]|nr:type II 3-dehydroquinate dehydratase [Candidatus Obscuribacterales bacterium]